MGTVYFHLKEIPVLPSKRVYRNLIHNRMTSVATESRSVDGGNSHRSAACLRVLANRKIALYIGKVTGQLLSYTRPSE
jgi:hypothetical protein